MRLVGERALVTGSTAGIGAGIAVELAAEGARVVVTGRDRVRGEAVAATARERAGSNGGDATFLAADLADEDACAELVDAAAARLGGLTVLVNNAASGARGDAAVAELATSAWEAILAVNLTAPMWCCRGAIPHLRAAGHGSIVNVSSRQAEQASRGLAAYITSKGGLNALTRSLAVDYAADGIRANTVSPGYVLNDRRDAELDDGRRARLEGMHLTRLGTARDVALAVVYLASRESETVTGTILGLDGGSSAARGLVLG